MRLNLVLLARSAKISYKYSNLPDSYIKRSMRKVFWEAPKDMPNYLPVVLEKKKFTFSENPPWTDEFKKENVGRYSKTVILEPIKEWAFFRGDLERNWVIVEGLNTTFKYIGKTKSFPGTMIKSEEPLLVTSEVALVDPSDNKATQVDWRFTEKGEKVRTSKRTGHIIPIPVTANETIDYKTKAGYAEQPKDTLAEDVAARTYVPQIKTFEMDLVDHYRLD
uniref:EOG090X0ADH n=1 Tax=Alona affinis TaxID=381656 RepID=A0A9N6WP78_9CRUS|nr:EOG090X0ADH [Alona affinis]